MKKAVMYGSGNIGRGFIGRLFSDSGYEVVFLSRRLTELLSQRGGYTVRSVGNEGATEKRVAPVRAVAAGSDGAVAEIASCDVMATAVGVRNLADIAPWIARGVAARMRASGGPLDILLCENLMDASAFMRREIYRCLDGAQRDWAEKNLGLVEVSVGCIVPQMDAEAVAGLRRAVRHPAGGPRRLSRPHPRHPWPDPLFTLRILHRPQALRPQLRPRGVRLSGLCPRPRHHLGGDHGRAGR